MQEASMPIVLRQEREICEKKASKKVQQISIPLAISQKIGMFHKALRALGEPEQLCFKWELAQSWEEGEFCSGLDRRKKAGW